MKEFKAVIAQQVAGTGDVNVKIQVDRDVFIGTTIMVLSSSVVLVEADLLELAIMSSSSREMEVYVTYDMPWSKKNCHKVDVMFWYDYQVGLLMKWKDSWVSGCTKLTEEINITMPQPDAKNFLNYVTDWFTK